MVSIYGAKINTLTKEIFAGLLPQLSEAKRKKINRYKFFADAQRSLLGEILTRYAIKAEYNIPVNLLEFETNDHGKPSLITSLDLHFNISHAGDWVVCALDNEPLGIDVEQLKSIDHKIAKRFFCPQEYQDLLAKPAEERDSYFYKIWTLKESYLKAEGKGLSSPISSFCFSFSEDKILLHPNNKAKPYYFWQNYLTDDYILALCTYKNNISKDIKIINLSELYSI